MNRIKKTYLLVIFTLLSFNTFSRANDTAKIWMDTVSIKLAELAYQGDLYDLATILPYHDKYLTWDTNNVHPYKFDVSYLKDTHVLVLSDHQDCEFYTPTFGKFTSGFGYRVGPKFHYSVVKRSSKKGKKGKRYAKSRRVRKHFVGYGSSYHQGVDISLDPNDSIYAAFDGIIRISQYNTGGYGNCIVIRHYNGLETLYGHLNKSLVNIGKVVRAGEVIGLAGSTGHSTGPHLHFETRYLGLAIDPTKIIDFGKSEEDPFRLKIDTLAVSKYTFTKYKTFARGKKGRRGRADLYAQRYYGGGKATKGIHIVRPGENLYRISKRYGVSINKLCQLNNLSREDKLQLGRKLKVQ